MAQPAAAQHQRHRRRPAQHRLTAAAAGLAAALLAGCGGSDPEPVPDPVGPPPPTRADAAVIWDYLQASEYSRYWEPCGIRDLGIHPGRKPHGPLVRNAANDTAGAGRPLKDPMPVGSVIALQNYTVQPHLYSIDVMAKLPGYRAETNDWYFVRFAPDGEVMVSDAEAMRRAREEERGCIHCHAHTADESDYLFKPRLRSPR
jgi:hypothetical protein